MGLFGNKKSKIDLENIISVVLLEQTQLYGKKNNWELSFGDTFGAPMVMEQTVPTGSRLKFSVTYRNGKKEIVEVLSGTAEADVLLQKAIDPEITDSSGDTQQKESVPYQPITVQKNQLESTISHGFMVMESFRNSRMSMIILWGQVHIMKMWVSNMIMNTDSVFMLYAQRENCLKLPGT